MQRKSSLGNEYVLYARAACDAYLRICSQDGYPKNGKQALLFCQVLTKRLIGWQSRTKIYKFNILATSRPIYPSLTKLTSPTSTSADLIALKQSYSVSVSVEDSIKR